jgi:hypothetical protein
MSFLSMQLPSDDEADEDYVYTGRTQSSYMCGAAQASLNSDIELLLFCQATDLTMNMTRTASASVE